MPKQFVVIGLGSFGTHLAAALGKFGHEVLAIDRQEKRVEEIKDQVTQAVIADATDEDALRELIPQKVDAVVVGMGDNLEASILTTLILRELKVEHIVVKAMSRYHARALELLGATEVVQPERDVALSLAERLTTPNLLAAIALGPHYSALDFATPERFFGKTLGQLKLRNRYNVLVIAVRNVLLNRSDTLPGADYRLEPDTVMTILARADDIAKLDFLRT